MSGWMSVMEVKLNQLAMEKKLKELETRLALIEGQLVAQGAKVTPVKELKATEKIQEAVDKLVDDLIERI